MSASTLGIEVTTPQPTRECHGCSPEKVTKTKQKIVESIKEKEAHDGVKAMPVMMKQEEDQVHDQKAYTNVSTEVDAIKTNQ